MTTRVNQESSLETQCPGFLFRTAYMATFSLGFTKLPNSEEESRCLAQSTLFIQTVQASVQFSRSIVSDSLRSHGLQHTRLPCPSPTPELTQTHVLWVSDTIQLSHPLVPFSSHLQSFLASGSFQMNQFFASGSQSIGVSASASVLPRNIQDWFPLGWTGLISLQSKGLSRVFSSTTVQKHQFFGAQFSL